jgi:hypothetical protein
VLELTKELTHTLDTAGTILAGCHVTGHYAGGRKAEITVSGQGVMEHHDHPTNHADDTEHPPGGSPGSG